MTNEELERRWLRLWERLRARGDGRGALLDVSARYWRPRRVYHTLTHVGDCLVELDLVRDEAAESDAIEFSLWYHDAEESEAQSAELARNVVRGAALPESFGLTVARLVLATTHTTDPVDYDAALIMDIDLSILGQGETRFDEYERQIREEYRHLSDDAFVVGRSAILSRFLERSFIYRTRCFRGRYEVQARRNLTRSLARLHA